MSRGTGGDGADSQAVPALHARMPHETRLRVLAPRLGVTPGIRIDGGGVRVVIALLTMAVLLAIAAGMGRPGRPVDSTVSIDPPLRVA